MVRRLRAQTCSLCHCLRDGNNARTHLIGEAAALSVGPALKQSAVRLHQQAEDGVQSAD